jgi:hypothetical protein
MEGRGGGHWTAPGVSGRSLRKGERVICLCAVPVQPVSSQPAWTDGLHPPPFPHMGAPVPSPPVRAGRAHTGAKRVCRGPYLPTLPVATTPRRLLHVPLSRGGFGGPVLLLRFQLRYLQGFYGALNSRNALVKQTARHALRQGVHGNPDVAAFLSICDRWSLHVSVVPNLEVRPSSPSVVIYRAWTQGDVVLVSDGSSPDGCLGWGALVADAAGTLATVFDGVCCDVAYSWAAEWAGKLAAVQLARQLGVPAAHIRWSIADNLSAVLGCDGGRPSHASDLGMAHTSMGARSHYGPPRLQGQGPVMGCTSWAGLHHSGKWEESLI